LWLFSTLPVGLAASDVEGSHCKGTAQILMRHIAILLALATLTFGQTFEVKDRNGIPVVMVSEIKMFRYS
jgi:hypothetical protein